MLSDPIPGKFARTLKLLPGKLAGTLKLLPGKLARTLKLLPGKLARTLKLLPGSRNFSLIPGELARTPAAADPAAVQKFSRNGTRVATQKNIFLL